MPGGSNWGSVIGAGCLAGIGFTMSLFVASLSLQGEILADAKTGILMGSAISGLIGLALLVFALKERASPKAEGLIPLNMVSRRRHGLPPGVASELAKVDGTVRLETLISLACPYCRRAGCTAQRLSMASDYITGDMVESSGFPQPDILFAEARLRRLL